MNRAGPNVPPRSKPGILLRLVQSLQFPGNIVKQTSENPPKFLVKLLFSFKGVNEVEVPAERIKS